MVTSDYGLTAESIARRIGIIREAQPRIVTGAELDSMDEAALRDALMGEVIFARVAPEHKLCQYQKSSPPTSSSANPRGGSIRAACLQRRAHPDCADCNAHSVG